MPKACNEASQHQRTRLMPPENGDPTHGARGSLSGKGWPTVRHRTPAAPPLGTGKQPFFRRCSRSRSLNPGALGLSQVHLGEGQTFAPLGEPHDPTVPGPSSAQSLTRGPLPEPPQLPDARLGRPRGWARAPRARRPRPSRPAGPGHSPGPRRRCASSAE